jgi:hypothetical protein
MVLQKTLIFTFLLLAPFMHSANSDDERRIVAAAMAHLLPDDAPRVAAAGDDYQDEEYYTVGEFHAPQNKAYDVVTNLVADYQKGIVCTEEEVRLAAQLCLDERDWGMLGHLFRKCPGLQWFFVEVDASGCAYSILHQMIQASGCSVSVCAQTLAEFPLLLGIDLDRRHLPFEAKE